MFDVGHGGGSFLFRQAVPATKQGFFPDVISTDLHIGSMNSGMKDIVNTMSKFLNLGMPLGGRGQGQHDESGRGHQAARISVISESAPRQTSPYCAFTRASSGSSISGAKMMGDQKLECELTVKAGQVVWDLNGISTAVVDGKRGDKMMLRRSLTLGLVLLLATNAWAQLASQTALVGTVTDRDGGVVPGAQVVAVNVGTKDTYETTTNAEGYYQIQFVRTGTYDVTVTVSGFQTFKATGVEVANNQVVRTNATLQLGALAESVIVTAGAPILETDTHAVSERINERGLSTCR